MKYDAPTGKDDHVVPDFEGGNTVKETVWM